MYAKSTPYYSSDLDFLNIVCPQCCKFRILEDLTKNVIIGLPIALLFWENVGLSIKHLPLKNIKQIKINRKLINGMCSVAHSTKRVQLYIQHYDIQNSQ